MSSQPYADAVGDMMLLGEFCEKDGPVMRQVWGMDTEPVLVQNIEGAEQCLHTFMMRAMSGDHVFPEKADAPLQPRSCEVLMDRVKWVDGSMMVAYICSVTLYDLYARGYARTVCIAYLSPDEHKMFAISHWLSLECQAIVKTYFDLSFERHKRELVRAVDALEKAKLVVDTQAGVLVGLTDRHKNVMAIELETLKSRVLRVTGSLPAGCVPSSSNPVGSPAGANEIKRRRPTRLAQSVSMGTPEIDLSTSFENKFAELRTTSSLTTVDSSSFANQCPKDDEIVEILDALITMKGTGVLRTLPELCGFDRADKAISQIRRTLWTFSQDTVWLMENVLQVMMPLSNLLERPLGELLTSNWAWNDDGNNSPGTPAERSSGGLFPTLAAPSAKPKSVQDAFYFKIGDCLVVDPFLRRNPPFPSANSMTTLTLLHEDGLFHAFKEYGSAAILTVMYNTLRCIPVIVCGDDVDEVTAALRLVSTFVPGLFQSLDARTMQIGVCDFPCRNRLAPELLSKFAAIGCPTDAVIFEGKPIYPQACVWHVQKHVRDKKGVSKGRTVNCFGAAYTLTAKGNDRVAPAAFVDPFGFDTIHMPVGVGLLFEVHDLLNIKSASASEEMALSNFLRLTLKRVFLEYATMAALVMQTLMYDTYMSSRPSIGSGNFNNNSFVEGFNGPVGQFPSSIRSPPYPGTPGHGTNLAQFPGMNSSMTNSMATVVSATAAAQPAPIVHRTPYVVCEHDVRSALESQHGYVQMHPDDVCVVTGMAGRLMTLTRQHGGAAAASKATPNVG